MGRVSASLRHAYSSAVSPAATSRRVTAPSVSMCPPVITGRTRDGPQQTRPDTAPGVVPQHARPSRCPDRRRFFRIRAATPHDGDQFLHVPKSEDLAARLEVLLELWNVIGG